MAYTCVFDKTNWEISKEATYGFEEITIKSINLHKTHLYVKYYIDTKKYLPHLSNKSNRLIFKWQHEKTNQDDNFKLLALNLVFQSFAAPANFARVFRIDLDEEWQGVLHRNREEYEHILWMFRDTMDVERNNLRHIMGLTSKGYIPPTQSTQDGMGLYYGNFAKNMDPQPDYYGQNSSVIKFDWEDHLIDSNSKVVLNMSFGKESLMTYNSLKQTAGLYSDQIALSIFRHMGDDFQSTYMDYVAEEPYSDNKLQVIASNYLNSLIVPICDVKLGCPIVMLAHVYSLLDQLAFYGEGYTHVLSGDEYDRNLPANIKLSSDDTLTKVYSYDYEQSPDYAAKLNSFQTKLGGMTQGSIMYGITGYQAQMVLDLTYDMKEQQKSCHTSHLNNGNNCGHCQKCTRIGAIKYLIGKTSNLDYEVTESHLNKLNSFSIEEFFITYMRIDDVFLEIFFDAVHALIEDDLNFEPWKVINGLCATNYTKSRPALYCPEFQKQLKNELRYAAEKAVEH